MFSSQTVPCKRTFAVSTSQEARRSRKSARLAHNQLFYPLAVRAFAIRGRQPFNFFFASG